MSDKEYLRIYYQNNKQRLIKKYYKWCKDNPKEAKAISKRYHDKVREEGEKHTNKSTYPVGTLKELYIRGYGKQLRKTKDETTHTSHKIRIICMDCAEYKTKECPGWKDCLYKSEIMEEIKK